MVTGMLLILQSPKTHVATGAQTSQASIVGVGCIVEALAGQCAQHGV